VTEDIGAAGNGTDILSFLPHWVTAYAIRAHRAEQFWMTDASWGEMRACGIGLFAAPAAAYGQYDQFFSLAQEQDLAR
jgi:hypothetical protein